MAAPCPVSPTSPTLMSRMGPHGHDAMDDDGMGDQDQRYATLVREQLSLVGEDPDRQGLRKTPERVTCA